MSQAGTYGTSGGGGSGDVLQITGNSGGAVLPDGSGNINVIGSGSVTTVGNLSANTLTIQVSGGGGSALGYTLVNTTPYTVLSTDAYLGVDCSGSAITIDFPNTTTTGRWFVVKDFTGNAGINPITMTTPGGTVDFDATTVFVLNSSYGAFNVLFDGSNYQIF